MARRSLAVTGQSIRRTLPSHVGEGQGWGQKLKTISNINTEENMNRKSNHKKGRPPPAEKPSKGLDSENQTSATPSKGLDSGNERQNRL